MDQCCSIAPTGICLLHSGHISSSAEVLVGIQALEVGTTAACRWYHLSIVEDAADPARPVEAFLFRPLTLDATSLFKPRRRVLLEVLVPSESESESTITASCRAG